jgi:hypothetical protein
VPAAFKRTFFSRSEPRLAMLREMRPTVRSEREMAHATVKIVLGGGNVVALLLQHVQVRKSG